MTRFTQVRGVVAAHTGTAAIVDVGAPQPIRQAALADAAVRRDLLERLTRLTAAGDAHNIVAKIRG